MAKDDFYNIVESSDEGSAYGNQLEKLDEDDRLKQEVKSDKRIGFYSFLKELGSGNFSKVVLAVHDLTKAHVAVKILKKSLITPKIREMLSQEVSNMERLHHPHIIQLYEVIHSPSKLYLAMELASEGDLLTEVTLKGKLPESLSKVLFSQLISAVQHMHNHKVIHRDLKLENIFLSKQNYIKIGDFGFSRSFSKLGSNFDTCCGSTLYAAPEIISQQNYDGKLVDVWALGVILYFMVTGVMPFKSETFGKLKQLILNGVYHLPPHLSVPCKHLINAILITECDKRASLKDIRLSEWLSGVSIPSNYLFYRKDPILVSLESSETEEALAVLSMEKVGITKKKIEEASLIRSPNQPNIKLYCGVDERSAMIGIYRNFLHQHQALLQASNSREQNAIKKMIDLKVHETFQLRRKPNHICQHCNPSDPDPYLSDSFFNGYIKYNEKRQKSRLCSIL